MKYSLKCGITPYDGGNFFHANTVKGTSDKDLNILTINGIARYSKRQAN
jgi:hypothetical protein